MRDEKKLGERREEYIHVVVHNLRSPINALFKAVYVLRQWENVPGIREKVFDGIERERVKITKMITSLLSAGVTCEGLEISLRKINLLQLLEEMFSPPLKFVSEGKVVEWVTRFEMTDPIITIDSDCLKEALRNIVENAIKYSGDHVRIEISCEDSPRTVWIRVRDNGWGINSRDLKHIFDKYYRVSKERTPKGYGLGLYYVKQVILAHHGQVKVYSTPGEGTEFIIKLPRNGRKNLCFIRGRR